MARPQQSSNDRAGWKQVELLRCAGVAGRFARARSPSGAVVELARKAIRQGHPDLSHRAVLLRFAELHHGPELAERVRAYLSRREQ